MAKKQDNQLFETVENADFADEMYGSYKRYAESVIKERAIPDGRDGLKPVQRRILYAMKHLGITPDKQTRKSARIVGETMGRFHPHGDSSIYEAMVRMGQDFSMSVPLVFGQGNFGSIDGDSAAAMRYTEAKMSKAGELILEDLDMDTVDMVDNFDGSEKEPEVLSGPFPNLIINGNSGIAVGMATNLVPHNPGEVYRGLVAMTKKPEISPEEMMDIIKGPDFPTGGVLFSSGISDVFLKGQGKITLRGRITDESDNKTARLVITEIPYAVNKETLFQSIGSVLESVPTLKGLRDESNKDGIRIVLEFRPDTDLKAIKGALYAKTPLQGNISVNNLCLVDDVPVTCPMMKMMKVFIKHQLSVLVRKSKKELEGLKQELHILKGLYKALMDIDNVVDIIKEAPSARDACKEIMDHLDVDEEQGKAIINLRLYRINNLQVEELKKTAVIKKERGQWLQKVIGSQSEQLKVLGEIFDACAKIFGCERRTIIEDEKEPVSAKDVNWEALEPEHQAFVVLGGKGELSKKIYQRRRDNIELGDGETCYEGTTKTSLRIVLKDGTVKVLKPEDLPDIPNALYGDNVAYISFKNESEELLVAQGNGVKKTTLDDKLKKVVPEQDNVQVANADSIDVILTVSAKGKVLMFSPDCLIPKSGTARPLPCMNIKEGDGFVGVLLVEKGRSVVQVEMENGEVRDVEVDRGKLQNRNGVGVYGVKVNKTSGDVVGVR